MARKRILLVDDELLVGESVKLTLETDGFEVVYVQSAAEAIRLYEPGKYDLIITDHRMPQMTGLELASHLKSIDRAQPILMLTGFPPAGALKVVDMMMVKPFAHSDLREAARRLASPESNPAPH
jgi:CheY-like chemotaxis protein